MSKLVFENNHSIRFEQIQQETEQFKQTEVDLVVMLDKVTKEKLEVEKKLIEAKEELVEKQGNNVMVQQEVDKEKERSKEETAENNAVIKQLELEVRYSRD